MAKVHSAQANGCQGSNLIAMEVIRRGTDRPQ